MSTPYSTVAPYFSPAPAWISPEDAERIQAYASFEDMYDNQPNTFKLMQRGSEANPLYIPAAKTIIEATNRFLAKDFDFTLIGDVEGVEEQREVIKQAFTKLFKRENFYAKFGSQRRYGLIRGDAVWHIYADPDKPEGSRISIDDIDPASYFPITDPNDINRLVGVHIVDRWIMDDETEVTRRQTYRKVDGTITSEAKLFETAAWDDRQPDAALKEVATLLPLTTLPAAITVIPVYHIPNARVPGSRFGASEVKGLERLFAAINQGISDEELSLALDGLGVYFTTSGAPVDDDGNETNWNIGPGKVIEGDSESDFKRVSGVSSVAAMQDHLKYIMSEAQRASGTPDIAVGNVNVTVAESGIALALHLAPVLAKNAEKEVEMLGVYDQMFYDLLHMWMATYESVSAVEGLEVVSIVGDPLPTDQSAEMEKIIKLYAAKLISLPTAVDMLGKIGFEVDPDEAAMVLESSMAAAEAADPFGARLADEALNAGDSNAA